MKHKLLAFSLLASLSVACSDDDDGDSEGQDTDQTVQASFTVTIENVVEANPFFQSGIFNTPDGESAPGPLLPDSGDTYSFSFQAGPTYLPAAETYLSFMTMLVASNDLFFAPLGEGIDLYDDDGVPLTGDITDQVFLWDAGTEVNRAPGSADQPPSVDTGTDETENVALLDEAGGVIAVTVEDESGAQQTFDYPAVDEMIRVTLSNVGTEFTVTIENVSSSSSVSTPLSPGGYAVHTAPNPFFTTGEPERENGVEEIAEDGAAGTFSEFLGDNTGTVIPLSPGVFAVHAQGVMPLFETGSADFGQGLEGIAEDGTEAELAANLESNSDVIVSGAFNTPVGADAPGAIGPGGSYTFEFSAEDGDWLSLATMSVQSNDWIYTLPSIGIPLFESGEPVSGDVSSSILLYDVGTEVNQFPGAGLDQVVRQAALDTGADDADNTVRELDPMAEGLQANVEVIQVTISSTVTN